MRKAFMRCVSFALTVLFLVDILPLSAFADAAPGGTTYVVSDSPDTYNLSCSLTVNGEPVTEGTILNEGDPFNLAITWYLPSSGTYLPADEFVYDLPDNVFLLANSSDTFYEENGTVEHGTYSISNNQLTVQFTQAFLNLSNPYFSISINGALSLENLSPGDGERYVIDFPGLEDIWVRVRDHSGLTISKVSQKRVVETGTVRETWVDYTITLTANGRNTNVILKDYFYNYDSPASARIGCTAAAATLNGVPFAITSDPDNTAQGQVVSSVAAHRVTAVVPEMQLGDVLVVTYSAKLSVESREEQRTPYGNCQIKNTVTAESDQCAPVSDSTEDVLAQTYIDKYGENVAGDPDLTRWYLFVCGGEYSTLTVQDILPANSHLICPDDTTVEVYEASGRNWNLRGLLLGTITYGQLRSGYTVTFPSSGWVIFCYTCNAEPDHVVRNAAKIVETNKTTDYALTHGNLTQTTGTKTLLSAEMREPFGEDFFDFYLLNQLDLNVGSASEDVEDFFFRDEATENTGCRYHHFPSSEEETIVSVEVYDPATESYSDASDRFEFSFFASGGTGETIPADGRRNVMYIRFVGGAVIPGQYRIRYYSVMEYMRLPNNYNSIEVGNTLRWNTGSSQLAGGGRTQKWQAYAGFAVETKAASTIHDDEIVWKIGSLGLNYYFQNHYTGEYYFGGTDNRDLALRRYTTVIDTLPAGLDFVAAAYGIADPVEGDPNNVAPISVTHNSNGTTTLEFPMYPDSANPQTLYIKTRYAGDYRNLNTAVTYTNTVKLKMRREADGPIYSPTRYSVTAQGTINPPVIADKGVAYNAETAPYANYTIRINQSALDLIPEDQTEQTYSICDTMGSALALDEATLLINGQPMSAYPELTLEVSSGGREFVISGLRDETAYTITYSALIMLSPGESFSSENSANTLEVTTIYVPARSNTETHISGAVFSSSSESGGLEGHVRVYKTDDQTPACPVSGAVFTVYNIGTAASVAGLSSLPVTGTPVAVLTTGEDGYSEFQSFEYGLIYGLRETTVPGGYADPTGGAMVYFGFRTWEMDRDGISFPAGVQDLTDSPVYQFEFTNALLHYGDLTVTKTLAGNDTDPTKDFTFTITLNPALTGTYSDVVFTNGVGTVTLKGGQSKTIEGLPNGTGYTVTEADYSADGYSTQKTGDIGTISETAPSVAAFTNTRYTYGSLVITKTVDGNAADISKAFNFTVTLNDTGINGTFGDLTFTNGIATFIMKHGMTVTAIDLPNGTGYTVTEADYSADGYVTAKTGDTGTIVGNQTKTAAFTNTCDRYGDLTVSKIVDGTGADPAKVFSFTVTLDDTSVSGTYGDMTFTDGIAIFTLTGGESKTAVGLPNGTGYTVTEADYEDEGYTASMTGETGTVVGDEEQLCVCTNTHIDLPNTGAFTGLYLWFLLFVACGSAIIAGIVYDRKRGCPEY